MIEPGRFREDLFFRLNVVHFQLPPLRERRRRSPTSCTSSRTSRRRLEDGPDAKIHRAGGARPDERYRWPGNIRELEN